MRYYFGIDFGTATSSIAFTTDKSTMGPELLELDGEKAITSAIRLSSDGKRIELIGAEAWEYFQEQPDRTFAEFKMDVGKGIQYERPGFTTTPEQVAIFFLTALREKIERQLGKTTLSELDQKHGDTTVIGYPAEWTKAQKAAVIAIAQKAGFPHVEGGVEPVGAIYYHAMNGEVDLDKEQKVFVYDFGGGTTDTAIVAMSRTLPPFVYDFDGLTEIGGRTYDTAIIENVFKTALGCDAYSPADLAEFQRKAQMLKEKLSNRILEGFDQAETTLSGLNCKSGASLTVSLDKARFETIQKASMDLFLKPVESTLAQTDFSRKDINLVIASGGSARLYFVDDMLRKYFPNSQYLRSNSPQEVIAKGLALYAAKATSKTKADIHLAEDEAIAEVEAVAASKGRQNATDPISEQQAPAFGAGAGRKNPFAEKRGRFRKPVLIGAAAIILIAAASFYTSRGHNTPKEIPVPQARTPSVEALPIPSDMQIKQWLHGKEIIAQKNMVKDYRWTFHAKDIIGIREGKPEDIGNARYRLAVSVSAKRGEHGVDTDFIFEYTVLRDGSLRLDTFHDDQSKTKLHGKWDGFNVTWSRP